MGTGLDDLRMLRDAEAVADDIWKQVMTWENFVRDIIGSHFVRAAEGLARQINAFASSIKSQQCSVKSSEVIREEVTEYFISNLQSPISNLH